jgi:hypothetical protein
MQVPFHGKKVTRMMNRARNPAWLMLALVAGWVTCAPTGADGADDPAARSLLQQQLQRQQQQEALQLRMQQQQQAASGPPPHARQRQALEQLQVEQRLRQQELHYRQDVETVTPQPADDPGMQRARDDLEKEKARQQGESLLRRSEAGQQQKK